jgi:outer membrane protein OmpA-like peptidoglycan-associated protein
MKKIVISFAITVLLMNSCIYTTKIPDTVVPTQQLNASGTMTPYSLTCDNYQAQVNRAKQAKDLVKFEKLLAALKERHCSADDLEQLKHDMSNLATVKASSLVQRGNLREAENWLAYKYTPINLWTTQSVHGDIAAQRKQWQEAALFYNQALDLIADPTATPSPPPHSEIQKVYNSAIEAQLLAEELPVVPTKSFGPSGFMRDKIGTFKITKRPIPIKFKTGKSTLTRQGKNSAKQLAAYLKNKKARYVILVGHTDPKGSDGTNCRLSVNRASSLRNYLVNNLGVNSKIEAMGKGERELYMSYRVTRYSEHEIDRLNRRVEFFTDPGDVSYDKECE